jgi:hypothetical protein
VGEARLSGRRTVEILAWRLSQADPPSVVAIVEIRGQLVATPRIAR